MFLSPYDNPHSIHHKIRTVSTPFIIWQSPLRSSYDSLYSLHSIHHMVVSALFITWLTVLFTTCQSLLYSSHDCLWLFITCQSPFYSSHASLHTCHHMTVSAPFIIIMTVLHPTNHFSAYHLVNRATHTMQHLLVSGMCMTNITFLCSLSLLITWWTMQHLLVFGMSMKNKS